MSLNTHKLMTSLLAVALSVSLLVPPVEAGRGRGGGGGSRSFSRGSRSSSRGSRSPSRQGSRMGSRSAARQTTRQTTRRSTNGNLASGRRGFAKPGSNGPSRSTSLAQARQFSGTRQVSTPKGMSKVPHFSSPGSGPGGTTPSGGTPSSGTTGTKPSGGTTPSGTKPTGTTPAPSGTKPSGTSPSGTKPSGTVTPKPTGTTPSGPKPTGTTSTKGSKSKGSKHGPHVGGLLQSLLGGGDDGSGGGGDGSGGGGDAGGGGGGGGDVAGPAYDMSGPSPGQAAYNVSDIPTPPADPSPVVSGSAPASLNGLWIAKPSDDVTVQLALLNDGAFVWTVLSDGSATGFRGTYQMDGGRMVLSAPDRQLAGNIAVAGANNFNFVADGSETNDAGLTFTR